MDITYVIIVITAISSLGIALDKLILPHQHNIIKDYLLKIWDRVDDIHISDVPKKMVVLYLNVERKIFGKRFHIRWWLSLISISIILTTFVLIMGRSLGIFLAYSCSTEVIDEITLFRSIEIGYWYYISNINHRIIYPLNILFDTVTLFVTVQLLSKFLNSTGVIRYIIILADIFICLLLFNLCFYLAFQLDSTAGGMPPNIIDVFPRLINDKKELGCTYYHVYLSTIFFVSTILIPTLVYLLMIFIFLVAKSSVHISKFVTLQITELGVSGDKSVFFYTGIFLSIVVIFVKVIKETMVYFFNLV